MHGSRGPSSGRTGLSRRRRASFNRQERAPEDPFELHLVLNVRRRSISESGPLAKRHVLRRREPRSEECHPPRLDRPAQFVGE
jgi:hypothetical protein